MHSPLITRCLQLAAVAGITVVTGCTTTTDMPFHTRSSVPVFDPATYEQLAPAVQPASDNWTELRQGKHVSELTPAQITDNEIVKRREKEFEADKLYLEARKSYAAKDYARAAKQIERSLSLIHI